MKIDPEALAAMPYELRVEIAENLVRLDWKPSEIDTVRRRCEEALRAKAKERQGARTDKHPEKFSESARGEAREKIAAMVGVSRPTIDKIAAVCDAAQAEPEKFGKLAADMDRTGRVDGPYKRLKVMNQAAAIRAEPRPYPGKGPYRVIIADPPWPYEKRQEDPSHRGVLPYTSMGIAEICNEAPKVQAIAHDDCMLWLWTTNHHMREAFDVLDAWGFQQKTILTWAKDKMGMGDWLRGQTEHCLLSVRGRPTVLLTNQTTILHAPMRAHSEKPEEFYDFVEKLCPAPRYATLFHRGMSRPNWDGHGDEYVGEAA
jgi:N6-adenosine-specific RNA methylase IME4